MIAPLSPRQAAFAKALVRGHCPSTAARNAGYGGNWRFAWGREADQSITAKVKTLAAAPARTEWGHYEEPDIPPEPSMSHEEWMETFARPALAAMGAESGGAGG
jgi:hypothetical protein